MSAATKPPTVLFLCTGNYYRSRFAEIVFNAWAAEHGLPWRAKSRGLALELGSGNIGPLSAHASWRLAELGIPLDGYLRMPRRVSEDDLSRADLVIAVKEAEHRPLLRERFPAWADRVEYWHVHDLDDASAEQALAVLEQELQKLILRLKAGEGRCMA